MKTARTAALNALNRCFSSGAWASQVLDNEISALDDREKALATRLCCGVLQNYMLLDFYIDVYCKKLDLPVRNILRLGAYQILFSDRIPVRAAVNESVNLCRLSGFKSACGLANAVLRKIAAGPLPEPEDLSTKYSHPDWFVKRLLSEHGSDFTEQFLKCDNEVPEINWHNSFVSGECYVQDRAAYMAVEMAGPTQGETVLDCCAAPGGKSFTAAVLMNNTGKILSCDISEKKLNLVKDGAERMGMTIISTMRADASVYNPDFAGRFDLVIADVPCSGFGVIRKKPEIRFKTESEISDLPQIQKRIVANVSRYVRTGGRMLYSTCTVFPEENHEVAESIQGFEISCEKTFYPNIDGTDGFYACLLKRVK